MTRIPFILLSTTDSSPLTGAAPIVTISKDGGAFASATNTPAEIGNGYYYVDLTTAETTVTNNVIVRATATGAQPTAVVWEPEQDLSGLSTFDPLTDTVTINATQASTLATASALSSVADNVGAVKAKTDNLPSSPAAVGSAMTLTEATVTAIRNNLATISTIEAAVVSLSGGLDTLAGHGDTYWSTADVSGLSTFDPTTDAVTINSTQAATIATATAQAAQTAALDTLAASILHWSATASTLTLYDGNGAAIDVYNLTRDSSGNITAIAPEEG